jgi:hypothetical protein
VRWGGGLAQPLGAGLETLGHRRPPQVHHGGGLIDELAHGRVLLGLTVQPPDLLVALATGPGAEHVPGGQTDDEPRSEAHDGILPDAGRAGGGGAGGTIPPRIGLPVRTPG